MAPLQPTCWLQRESWLEGLEGLEEGLEEEGLSCLQSWQLRPGLCRASWWSCVRL